MPSRFATRLIVAVAVTIGHRRGGGGERRDHGRPRGPARAGPRHPERDHPSPRSRRLSARAEASEHRPDPDRRPALGHALVDAERAEAPGRSRRHVRKRVRHQLVLLPQPLDHPDRQLLPHDRHLRQPPPARRRRRLPPLRRRQVHDRHLAAEGRIHHRARRQVPERLPGPASSLRGGTRGTRSTTALATTASTSTRTSIPPQCNGAFKCAVTYPKTAYSTNVLAGLATRFIRTAPTSKPMFLYFAPYAPHLPATPSTATSTASRTCAPTGRPTSTR